MMKLLPVVKYVVLSIALLVLAAFGHTAVMAASVTYSTTASFNGGAFSSPNAIVYGTMGNQLALTFTGMTNVTANANLATYASLGQIQTAITGNGATITAGTTFALRITQTAPTAGTGTLSATVFGVIRQNSSTGPITFSVTSVTIGSITYTLTNPVVRLVPPASNNGITTIQGQITSTSLTGPSATETSPWPDDHDAWSAGAPLVDRAESALATGVTYSTTCSFNGGAFSSPNAIVYGAPGNQMSITCTGVSNLSVTADPTTFASLGQIQTATTGNGATITPGSTFSIRVTQTSPGAAVSTFTGTLGGVVTSNSSTGLITFTNTSVLAGGIPYTLSSGPTPFVPFSTNNGLISLQAQINLNHRRFDHDGDGRSDISVFRPSNATWFLNRSTAGMLVQVFGLGTDKIAPADYDGDGKTDIAVYRPAAAGQWFILNSSSGTVSSPIFGITEDLVAPGDYDGDGKADICVFRPSTATWWRQNSSNGTFSAIQFGLSGDRPTVGDFDSDGRSDIGIWRPSNGDWYHIRSSDNSTFGERFGVSTDKIVPADYDGDGKTDIAVWRPSTGIWYIKQSSNDTYVSFQFGLSADLPAPGDFDGDGRADRAVFRPSDGNWYITNSASGSFTIFPWGLSGDRPTPGAFLN